MFSPLVFGRSFSHSFLSDRLDAMTFFLRSCLVLLHAGQFIWTCIVALLYQPFVTNPLPLDSPHSKLPHSLVLILSTTTDDPADDEIEKTLESIACAARCCMKAGIGCLSVYDRHGSSSYRKLS